MGSKSTEFENDKGTYLRIASDMLILENYYSMINLFVLNAISAKKTGKENRVGRNLSLIKNCVIKFRSFLKYANCNFPLMSYK